MTFDDFWKNRQRGIFTDEDYARMAWDAAIDAARETAEDQDCDQTEYMCNTITRAAKAIHALRSNAVMSGAEKK